MNEYRGQRSGSIVALLACSALAGCSALFSSSPPISYYTLTPKATAAAPLPAVGNQIIAVQTVRLPDYLNQSGIVTRTEANAINVAKDTQWAGALDDNITRVIVSNLSVLLGSTKVVAFPVSAALPVDRVVQVDISQFEEAADGTVTLAAQWTIFADGGRTYAATDAATYTLPTTGRTYGAIAATMSQLLETLSQDIATALASTSQFTPRQPSAARS